MMVAEIGWIDRVRRLGMHGWLALAMAIGALACGPASESVTEPASESASTGDGTPVARAANLLLITSDTTRADHLGCYGEEGDPTPAIDGLAAAGVLFEQARTPVPVTLPAHTSLLTGDYPPVTGVRDNDINCLAPAHETLAEILRGEGFSTGAFVSSFVLDSQFGLDQGFDVYAGVPKRRVQGRFLQELRASQVTDSALDWLGGVAADRRFFVWVHYYDPHWAYDPPEPFRQRFTDDPYLGEIAYVDSHVRRLVDGLERLGRLAETLVVFTSDHGEGLGEHGEQTHGVLTYDATLKVPLIFSHHSLTGGRRVADPVSLIDVLPTTLAFLGVTSGTVSPGQDEAETDLRGHDLAPLLFANDRPPWAGRPIYFETRMPWHLFRWSPLEGVVMNGMKYIEAPRPELYDLADDPGETMDRLADLPQRAALLKTQLQQLGGAFSRRAQEPQEPLRMSDEDRQRLAALGYVQSRSAVDSPETPIDPKERIHHAELVMSLWPNVQHGRLDEAWRGASEVLETEPDNFLALEAKATVAFERSKDPKLRGQPAASKRWLEEAVSLVTRALELEPASVTMLHLQATCLMRLGRSGEAEQAWKAAVEAQASFAPAHRWLGLIAQQRGDLETARREYRAFLKWWGEESPVMDDVRRRLDALDREE